MKKFFLSIGILFLLSPSIAGAHATPTTYEPAPASVLTEAPDAVRIYSSERIDPSGSDVSIFAPDGTKVTEGESLVAGDDARVLERAFLPSGIGTYTVTWRIVSADDGHFTKGTYTFSLGETLGRDVPSLQFQMYHKTAVPEAIAIAIELLGQAILLATMVLLLLLRRPLWRSAREPSLRKLFEKRAAQLVVTGALLVLIGGGCYIALRAADLQAFAVMERSAAFLEFLSTVAGRMTLYRMLLGIAVVAVFFLGKKSMFRSERVSPGEMLCIGILLLAIALRTYVSHAAASHVLPMFSVMMNALHLVAKDLWIGGVIAFAALFFPLWKHHKDAATLGFSIDFSRLLNAALALGGVTGVYMIWLHLKSPGNLLQTQWGQGLFTLGFFAGVLLALRLYQQCIVDPALTVLKDHENKELVRSMPITLLLEAFIGICVLFLSSMLIITTPPLGVGTSALPSPAFGIFCMLVAIGICLAAVLLSRLSASFRSKAHAASPAMLGAFRKPWFPALLGSAAIVFLGVNIARFDHNGFRSLCLQNGHYWHESVPMRFGQATSVAPFLGCMLGSGAGQFHFADLEEYRAFTRPVHALADLTVTPARPQPGTPATLLLRVRDLEGHPAKDLLREHDRIMHVTVISKDLETFAHIHAEDTGPITDAMLESAAFPMRYTFPEPGRYLVAVDYTIRSQTFSQEFYVDVGNASVMSEPAVDSALQKTVDGFSVTLRTPPEMHAGLPYPLTYTIEKNGEPVTDLEPYLAAPMHIALSHVNLRKFTHMHGELPQGFFDRIFNLRNPELRHFHQYLPDRFGPDIRTYVTFPAPGTYVLFGQFKHNGQIHVGEFMVTVR